MAHWVRFAAGQRTAFGELQGDFIRVHAGDLFGEHGPTAETCRLNEVTLLAPCRPGKFVGLWNNFRERAAREGLTRPAHPLYFVKTDNCYLDPGATIRQPASYDGPVVFEGELGIVIGAACRSVDEAAAGCCIFGYTCVNDVTARGVLKADPSFPQWVRAKSYDTFGPIGPAIATGIDPDALVVRTRVNGVQKQCYPVADMFYLPHQIVSRLSHDMTLQAGDVIACGTSLGVEPMPSGCTVDVDIDGIGVLRNRFE
jgi:2-keto-4-pentenoate hydratase/2-oxohepta-3-ene-1,7-dioic acid hydratase in catechol pathway